MFQFQATVNFALRNKYLNFTFARLNTEAIYRYLAVMIMFTAFFAQTFNGSLIVAGYYVNTQSFAARCENKLKPELHCNGKCQMRKQVSKEENKDQQNPERKDSKREIICAAEQFSSLIKPFILLQPDTYPRLSNSKEIRMPRSILRPPIV